MNKTTTTAVTGLAVAMAAGTAAYMMAGHNQSTGKKLKRNAAKAVKTLGTVLDSVETFMK